jgi:hypothetical protein
VVGISSNVRLVKPHANALRTTRSTLLEPKPNIRTTWIADARGDGTRFVVNAELVPSNHCVTAASVTM